MYSDDGDPEDIVPEHVAIRRGMVYSLDRHGKVCQAEIEAPLLIDQLYNHEIISSDHHFYGVQFITMRKVFLAPVRVTTGMLILKREDEATTAPQIPMEDTDYLRVLRMVRNLVSQRLLREICDEAAEPAMYQAYGRQRYAVDAAFDALCEAVQSVWQIKKDCIDRGCRKCDGGCTAKIGKK